MAEKQSIKRFIVRDPHGHIEHEDSFSVVGEVHVDIVPGHGEPYAESEYIDGTLTITIHNIEGNGITEITTDSQEGDEAVNTVTIKTDDNPEGETLQVRNGSRGNGIASSSEVLSPEDGGINTHTIVDTDGNEHVFHTKNGRKGDKGDQGDSVLVGEGDLPLAHVTGLSNQKAMSQVGLTDAIKEGMISNGATTKTQNVNYYSSGGSSGFYVDSTTGGFVAHASNRSIELALTADMKTIKYAASAYVSLSGGYAFVDDAGNYISGVKTTSAVEVTIDVATAMRNGATKFRCSKSTTSGSAIPLTIIRETFSWPQIYDALGNNTNGWMTQEAVNKALSVEVGKWTKAQLDAITTRYWYIDSSTNKWSSTTDNNYATKIDFEVYRGITVAIKANANYNAQIAFIKTEPTAAGQSAVFCENTSLTAITKGQTYIATVPEDCVMLYVRKVTGGNSVTPSETVVIDNISKYIKEIGQMIDAPAIVYVSSSGNDENPGTADLPKKTIAAALDAGAADMTVVLLSDITGGISLNNWNGKKNHVTIRGDKNQNRKIIVGKKLAGEGWQAYEGHDDVYSYTKGDGETLPTDSIQSQYLTYYWLWQYDIADTRSLISASERHPLQRGCQYRMRSTRVEYVATLAALLAATSPCWTLDDGKLYVRVVAGSDTAANPIYMPSDYGNAITTGNFRVTLSNIETWFGRIYVGGWAQSSEGNGDYLFEAKDCAVRCCTGSGGWQIDDGVSVHLERCEAEGVTMIGSTGDGFNLHPQSGDTRPFAKDSTHTLVDCWAHDNRDDGYSDHGRSEGTIIGGLFEHNGKGGLAPATGSHDTIYMATCQNNNSGILLAGNTTEGGGIGTQVSCFGCVCINNLYNFNCVGYTAAQQVKLELNNCISRRAKNNGAAIYAHNPCEVVVRDCTDYGSPVAKKTESDGVITIDNGTVIS